MARAEWLVVLILAGILGNPSGPLALANWPDLAPAGALDRAAIRRGDAHLDDRAFREKLKAALESPLLFLRSFNQAFYADLASGPTPGPVGFCVGDAHPENFGFYLTRSGTHFDFNDLDDSGPCPVLLDALRYFVALKLSGEDSGVIRELIESYSKQVGGSPALVELPRRLVPDLEKKQAKNLKKYVDGHHFVLSDELSDPGDSVRSAIQDRILEFLRREGRPTAEVRDVARLARAEGGSGGLRRYWVLASDQDAGWKDILEVKEEITPAVAQGHWGAVPRERVLSMAAALWGKNVPRDFGSVFLDDREFLVRSRAKSGISAEDLKGSDGLAILRTETSLLAMLHARTWSGRPEPEAKIRVWLEANWPRIAERWDRAYHENSR